MVAPVRSQSFLQSPLESHGVAIPFASHIITPAIETAILNDQFEAEEAAELPDILVEGERVLEIGAGIGFISTLLDRDDRVEKVLAFEANPGLMDYMARLHATNGVRKVERHNAVLTNDGDKSKTFYLREDFWMGSLASGPNPYRGTANVPTAPLNDTLRDESISLIVCDIEGAEAFLFDDVDFAQVDRVYLEVHDHITGLKGIASLFGAMQGRGFTYDPRHSSRSIILFRKVEEREILRPYAG